MLIASSSVFRPGANGAHSSRPKYEYASRRERYGLASRIHSRHFVQDHRGVLLTPQDRADRLGDVRWRKLRRRDLVEERRKQVMVTPIDQRHLHGSVSQALRGVQPREPSTDDNHMRLAFGIDRGLNGIRNGNELLHCAGSGFFVLFHCIDHAMLR
jgi:hypothetical protein